MTPLKVDVLIASFCYGGNGGCATILPEIATWLTVTWSEMAKDERIGRVAVKRYGDTPLTMERNRVVVDAINEKFDIILMLDSDNLPDLYLNHRPWAVPFWRSSFDFIYERLTRGLPSVVCAPYCGPPPHPIHGGEEVVYVFHAESRATDPTDPTFKFQSYGRQHAAMMRGIQECIAGPTGMILYTLSAFELMRFDRRPIVDILADFRAGLMTPEQCAMAVQMQSWFFYEYTDSTQSAKASTEDVTNTREIGMAGFLKHGEPVLFCNWDAWAGHMKPQCVGKPEPVMVEQVTAVYQQAVLDNQKVGVELHDVSFGTPHERRSWITENTDALNARAEALREFHSAHSEPPISEILDDLIEAEGGNASPSKNGGVPITSRMICGRKVSLVGNVTADDDLAALTRLAKNVGTLKGNRPLRMLEVGSWVGESATALLGGAPKGSDIYCVDTWEGTPSDATSAWARIEPPFPWFVKNMEDLIGDSVKPVKGHSLDVAKSFSDPQDLDIVFLDADHTYEACRSDIHAWIRHVAQTGILCGHDYGIRQLPGVKVAVDEFAEEHGLHVGVVAGTSIWFIGKAQTLPEGKAASRQQENQHGRSDRNPEPVASLTG